MSDPGQHLNRGPDRTKQLDAIVKHGYDKHVVKNREFGDPAKFTPSHYRKSAEKLLDQGTIGHALKQGKSTNYLIADRKLGTVSYINTAKPSQSTHFVPRDGVDKRLSRKLGAIPPSQRQKLDLPKIRAVQGPTSPAAKPAASSSGPKPASTPPRAPAASPSNMGRSNTSNAGPKRPAPKTPPVAGTKHGIARPAPKPPPIAKQPAPRAARPAPKPSPAPRPLPPKPAGPPRGPTKPPAPPRAPGGRPR